MFTCCEFWHKSTFFCPICSVVFVTYSTARHCTALHGTVQLSTALYSTARHCTAQHGTALHWRTPETKLPIISEAEACPISTQYVNSEVRAKHACLNMTVIVSALLALKPITAGNTSPVCQLQKLWEAIVSTQCHNCKLLADARVADSAAPIWIAPSFWDNFRKSSSNSKAEKHHNVQGVCFCQHNLTIKITAVCFFNIIYNILQKNHIFILISKQFKCPSTSVQMPWAEKLMWVSKALISLGKSYKDIQVSIKYINNTVFSGYLVG